VRQVLDSLVATTTVPRTRAAHSARFPRYRLKPGPFSTRNEPFLLSYGMAASHFQVATGRR
jgi:hypothetical protein